MAPRFLVFAIVGFLALGARAQEPVAKPEATGELASAIQRQIADREALQAKTDESLAALRKWYTAALDAVKKEAMRKGKLDEVLAVDAEREHMERDLTMPEKYALQPELLTVRGQFDQARAKVAAQQKAALAGLLRGYLTTLEPLEKKLTQKGEIESALAVRKERAAAAEMLKNEAPPAAPAPAVAAAATPARPAATPPPAATPALIASRPIPPPGGLFKGSPPPFKVAAELKAKGVIKEPAAEAIPFDAPPGNGRSGARGVLLKNEPDTGKNGTTWTFNHSRGPSAEVVQIVHPHGRGQTVINLKTKEVTIATPTAWSQVGWGGNGDPKKVKMTKAAGEVFPLKDNQRYNVISAVTPSGNFTLTIDNKVVATGRIGAAAPLGLDGGFGNNMPDKCSSGYALLIVGPRDGDSNECRDIMFQASAPEAGR